MSLVCLITVNYKDLNAIECFVKCLDPIIALILYYPVLNLVHTTSDPKGTYINYLGVNQKFI